MLGRTDDVINVAGHRIGTREIEEALQLHERVAETAVIGVQNKIKGQVPLAFIVKKEIADVSEDDDYTLREELDALITEELGRFAKQTKCTLYLIYQKLDQENYYGGLYKQFAKDRPRRLNNN